METSKRKKSGSFFKKRKLPKLDEFPENLRYSNINGAMHNRTIEQMCSDAHSITLNKN